MTWLPFRCTTAVWKNCHLWGLMKIRDAETGHEQWIDTSSRAVRRAHHDWWVNKQVELNETFTKSNVDNVSVRTDQDYVKALLNLFAKRN